jgi:hypothetical protein
MASITGPTGWVHHPPIRPNARDDRNTIDRNITTPAAIVLVSHRDVVFDRASAVESDQQEPRTNAWHRDDFWRGSPAPAQRGPPVVHYCRTPTAGRQASPAPTEAEQAKVEV